MVIQANNKDIILLECNIERYSFDAVNNICDSIKNISNELQIIIIPEGFITDIHIIKKGYSYE